MTNYLLGVATGVAITYALLNLDKLKAKYDAYRAKK